MGNTRGYKDHTYDWFVKRARDKHGDKYGYAAAEWFYNDTKHKVPIYCPIHDRFFWQAVGNHINSGQGCPDCGFGYAYTHTKGNKTEFLRKVHEKFGNNYSFPGGYENNKTPVVVHCNKCGYEFTKRPNDLLCTTAKELCPKCRLRERKNKSLISYDELINKCDELFGKGNYLHIIPFDGLKDPRDNKDKVTLHCDLHGDHEVTIYNILKGYSGKCKKCESIKNAISRSTDFGTFEKQEAELWGDAFSYDKSEFVNMSTPMTFTCKKCGYKFKRKPSQQLQLKKNNPDSLGCKKCTVALTSIKRRFTTEEFVARCKDKYGDLYEYDKVKYVDQHTKVTVHCNRCGRDFDIDPCSHLNHDHGCPYHYCNRSKQEEDVKNYVASIYNGTINNNDRTILKDMHEIDIFLPEKKLAIEYNGIFWHSEGPIGRIKSKNYHLDKQEQCEAKNIRLIQIFEDEWFRNDVKQDIWKSMIKTILGLNKNHIYARKCNIKLVDSHTSADFLRNNHLQGECGSSIRIGLYYKNELVSLMTFGKCRHFIGGNNHQYELIRFCNKKYTVVVGAASKLFKYFIEKYNPQSIVSYADRRWSNGHLYYKLGFSLYNKSKPNYYYLIKSKRMNRFNFRKSILVKKYGCPENMSEHEFCYSKGWYRIYDCGCLCFEWKNDKSATKS